MVIRYRLIFNHLIDIVILNETFIEKCIYYCDYHEQILIYGSLLYCLQLFIEQLNNVVPLVLIVK